MKLLIEKICIGLCVIVLFSSCKMLFGDKQAIKVCQNAKVQLQSNDKEVNIFLEALSLGINATWLDFANTQAKKTPNIKLEWHAEKTNNNNCYLVEFTDTDGWGFRWEVDIDQQIVKFINNNQYLVRKYGFSRMADNKEFEILNADVKGFKISTHNGSLSYETSSEKVFSISGSVKNKTDKIITSANIKGTLKLIFEEKTVEIFGNYESGFKNTISVREPWKPNTDRQFYIKTDGIDEIYLNYVPSYVFFDISLIAEDPVGYVFNKDIGDFDLKDDWKIFTTNGTNSKEPNAQDKAEIISNKFTKGDVLLNMENKPLTSESVPQKNQNEEGIILMLENGKQILLSEFPDESYSTKPREWRTNTFSDIDSDGLDELLTEYFSGGANCCVVYNFFQKVSENRYKYVCHFGENGNIMGINKENKIWINFSGQLNYFQSCRACNIDDQLPNPNLETEFYLIYKDKKFQFSDNQDKKINQKILENLRFLNQRELPKSDGFQDDGTRKSYAKNIITYYFNNERSLNSTHSLFNQYYSGNDKGEIWSNIEAEIQSLLVNYCPQNETENNSKSAFYRVTVEKSFFHSEPNESTIRKGYLVRGERILGVQSQNGFVLTEFTNAAGKKSVGWIKLSDVEKNQ